MPQQRDVVQLIDCNEEPSREAISQLPSGVETCQLQVEYDSRRQSIRLHHIDWQSLEAWLSQSQPQSKQFGQTADPIHKYKQEPN